MIAPEVESTVPIAAFVSDVARKFLAVAEALDVHEDYATQITTTEIKDELTRFKVWAGNIAAHRKGRRSLEYRLRDALDLKGDVHRLLEALAYNIHEILAIVQGEKVPWDAYESSDSDTDSGITENELEEVTELRQILASIRSTVTSLFRLSMAIRDPAPTSQYLSNTSVDKSFFQEHDTLHVQSKYPNCPPYLQTRLGRAISRRRQYLSYREEHQKKLSKDIEKVGHEELGTEYTSNSTEATSAPMPGHGNTINDINEDDDIVSQTSYASSINTSIRVPSLPKNAQTNEFFECPLCFMIVSIHTEATWKKHVYQDLHPYCCTFEDCATADRLYDSRHSWFEHELSHRGSWQCIEGCGETFVTHSKFENHVREAHSELMSIFSAIERSSMKRANLGQIVNCLLCKVATSLKGLQKHLATHQEQLALFVLPPNLEETEDDEERMSQGPLELQEDDEEPDSCSDDVAEADGEVLGMGFSTEVDKSLILSGIPFQVQGEGTRKLREFTAASELGSSAETANTGGAPKLDIAPVSQSDPAGSIQNISEVLTVENSQPLPVSTHKNVLFARLGLTEQIHEHLLHEAQQAGTALSLDPLGLTDSSRTDPSVRVPYKWDQISEKAKLRGILTLVHNATPYTEPYYNMGRSRANMNEDNWVARWYLWHSFPRQKIKDPQDEMAEQNNELSLLGNKQRPVKPLDESELGNDLANLPANRETKWEQIYVDGDIKSVQRGSGDIGVPDFTTQEPLVKAHDMSELKAEKQNSLDIAQKEDYQQEERERGPTRQRRPTIHQRLGDSRYTEECRDPDCTTCSPISLHNLDRHTSEAISQRSDPNPYYTPPSPTHSHRQPALNSSRRPAVTQIVQSHRPTLSSHQRRQSFAGNPNASSWVPDTATHWPSAPYDRSTLSSSANEDNTPVSDSSESELEYDVNIDARQARILMPPPKLTRILRPPRPPLPHAQTSQARDDSLRKQHQLRKNIHPAMDRDTTVARDDVYTGEIKNSDVEIKTPMPLELAGRGSSDKDGGKAIQPERTTVASQGDDEIRLRVDGTMPLSLQLSGDMEGRTLRLVPAENGMTDLVIGGSNPRSRSGDSAYQTQKGGVVVNNSRRRSIISGRGRRDTTDVVVSVGDERSKERPPRDGKRDVQDTSRHSLDASKEDSGAQVIIERPSRRDWDENDGGEDFDVRGHIL